MNDESVTHYLQKKTYVSLYFSKGQQLAQVWERYRDRKTKDADTDWSRTTILTFS